MYNTYNWLYLNYAEPLMNEFEKTEKREIELIAQSLGLSQRDSVQLSDRMSALRYRWGAEVFALGLQLGVRLTAPSLSVEDHP